MDGVKSAARLRLAMVVVAASTGMGGCGSYSPAALPVGSAMSEAERALGPRTGTHALPDGVTRLEFARGPFGKHTYMLNFGPEGRLRSWQQVLTEKTFNELPIGLPRAALLSTLGRPAHVMILSRQRQTVWSYRYDAPFCLWFQVSLDDQGKVAETSYATDPACEVGKTDRLR